MITVDHVLEATRGAAALRRRGVVDANEEHELQRAILRKFRSKVIDNTVAPRQLARLARAVEREEVPLSVARRVTTKLIKDPQYSIGDAFAASVEQVDFVHNVEQASQRLEEQLAEHEVAATKLAMRCGLLSTDSTMRSDVCFGSRDGSAIPDGCRGAA